MGRESTNKSKVLRTKPRKTEFNRQTLSICILWTLFHSRGVVSIEPSCTWRFITIPSLWAARSPRVFPLSSVFVCFALLIATSDSTVFCSQSDSLTKAYPSEFRGDGYGAEKSQRPNQFEFSTLDILPSAVNYSDTDKTWSRKTLEKPTK